MGAEMTRLFVGLFLAGVVCWTGNSWAQSVHPGGSCTGRSPACMTAVYAKCSQQTNSDSSEAYKSCVAQNTNMCPIEKLTICP